MDGNESVQTYLPEGVVYASSATAHLDSKQTKIWVALYTSCALFIDDTTSCPSKRGEAYQLNNRFNLAQTQGNGVLDAFADLLRQLPEHFQAIPSNIITTSTMNYVTGNLLELETEGMEISSDAVQYPSYSRTMPGLAEGYAFFIFPREIPVKDYVQAVPEMMTFQEGINDVFSFYKEEKSGEPTNRVSLLAARNKTSELEVLEALAENTVQCCSRILKILEPSPAAYAAFKDFAVGLATFFALLDRYQLSDIQLYDLCK
ncbi:isoprenoid synthase domain-containing protein [Phlebopus sp. FC_14]|nr:isoprenoid synthase domain-containing protein [Phlebopus sp. FC_14]